MTIKYVVVWENGSNYIFPTEKEAAKQIKEITGKEQSDWISANGDYDEDGNNVYYFDAEEK